ncbi:homoserine O-acetyltransferase family protein [Roseivirga seohaensis]|uniref:homoserine O-acetyltransferase family protein n=1 Tax=Roseivirga seohaensis TaxID=1914963 RepID=UPI00069FD8D1|nr:homoserine O-acetyltransferase [Roseivirga seohaensis]
MTTSFPFTQNLKKVNDSLHYYRHSGEFRLESGEILNELQIAYQTFGELNSDKSNVIWVCHALTANADPIQWWPGLIGYNYLINPDEYFIVCANILGSCYGTTGPKDFDPNTGERYLSNFPNITIRDQVKAHILLRKHLEIERIHLGMGGSTGGQQILEWVIEEPIFDKLFVIATSAQSSPWGKAIRAAQRMAIEADPSFYSSSVNGGKKGMEAARAMALLSYRTPSTFNQSQKDDNEALDNYRAESYQRYQGLKLSHRFDARSYYVLGKAMDTHNVGRGRGNVQKALATIKAETLIIGIEGDILFPIEDQQIIAEHLPNSTFKIIQSDYGHDGFLIETQKISEILKPFLNNESN